MEPHILVADDDPDNRELVQFLLQSVGFDVRVTCNAAEVLYLASHERFDALVLDNWMPDITGLELCRQIRRFDQLTPILFCSGAVTEADIEAAKLAGAQGYIGKPFDPDDLINAIREAVASARQL
ncbi:MAG TPA: response regulator [Pyrinomonadaceae bacterium]|nr:response regulator [Pyrinomonadaceae bacterium]